MKSRVLMFATAMTLLVVLAMPLLLAAQQQHNKKLPHYTVTVLGTLGGTFSQSGGLNNRGSIAGFSALLGDQTVHAFLWRNGMFTDLGTLGGPNSFTSEDVPLNDRGAVTGYSDTSTPDPNGEDVCGDGNNLICLPFIWQKGVMTPLPLLGGNNGIANEINNRGQVVGQSETSSLDPCSIYLLRVEGALWENGRVQELPPFPGDPDSVANAINDNGEAVGGSGCATGNIRAVL